MKQKTRNESSFEIIFPNSGTGLKELKRLYKRRESQFEKTIEVLRKYPTNFRIKGIEKLKNSELGNYTIRLSKGDRIFYDVDLKNKKVFLLRAGKHDLYKLA